MKHDPITFRPPHDGRAVTYVAHQPPPSMDYWGCRPDADPPSLSTDPGPCCTPAPTDRSTRDGD